MQTIICEIDIIRQQELPVSKSLTVSIAVGNFVQEVGMIRLERSTGGINLELLIPVFATFVLVALACGTLIGCAIIKMKGRRYVVFTLTSYFMLVSSVAKIMQNPYHRECTDDHIQTSYCYK